ncbi:MAG TPA: LysR substrate-binding domain-containing protein [Ramlibacter sp.]|nr:LysR substrate-binding domain-containing protein [Ramlibacter sp.]
MRVFQQVVGLGGFAAAARKLDLAPAVVTRLVSDLEQHLGVRLLQRTSRRLALTDAGEEYLQRLKAILGEIDEAESLVQVHTSSMSGTVRVLAPPVAATHLLGPAVARFQLMHPAVAVDVQVEDSPDPAVEDYDLAVLSGSVHIDPDAIIRPILLSHGVLCASPDYLQRHGEPREPADMAAHRFLQLRLPGQRPGPLRLLDSSGQRAAQEVEVTPVLTANHTDTLLGATLEGAGISSQPDDLLAPLIASGRLQVLLQPWITARLALVAVLPSRKFLPSRTRAFLDFLVAHARDSMLHGAQPFAGVAH